MSKKSKYSVLVVDDEPNNIIALTEILESKYTVYAVVDSVEAIETAEEEMPDIILLDILMPEMDGYEIITALKRSKKTRDIPVIYITGLDSSDAQEKGFALGAADYIPKPFHPAIVETRVRNQIKLIERYRQQALMTKIAHSFLTDAYIDPLITDTLRIVGEFMDVAQLLLYRLEFGILTCQNEWIDPELSLPSRIGSRLELDETMSEVVSNMLISRESDLYLHSNDSNFKEAMKPFRKNFQNFITTPIFIKGRLCAVVDFSREDDGREWDENEISLATLVADVFSGVFERDAMEQQFSIVENTPNLVFSITPEGEIEYINPAVMEVTGYTRGELLSSNISAIFSEETASKIIKEYIPDAMTGGKIHFETQITRKDGGLRIIAVSIFKTGQASLGLVTRDLTEIRKLEKENEKIFFDGLTNIYNRRFFNESIERIIKSLSRSDSVLTLIMADIDCFKQFNDTYGHTAGDECLRKIANVLDKCAPRADDFVARYGGEEFVLVLSNTDENGARNVAERILSSVRELGIPHENSSAADHVTISIGIVTDVVRQTHTPEDFINKADMMLYKSKQGGRDRYNFDTLQQKEGNE